MGGSIKSLFDNVFDSNSLTKLLMAHTLCHYNLPKAHGFSRDTSYSRHGTLTIT